MRIALTLGFTLLLAQAGWAQSVQPGIPASPARPQVLSATDAALYREAFAAERNGEISKAKKLLDKVSDPILQGYVEASRLIAAKNVDISQLKDWLSDHRDHAVADKVYRLAVARSTRKVRRHHKTTVVAVVTNIPAPLSVPRRTGGFEDEELPEPTPSAEAGRAILSKVLADIKAGQPDTARARLEGIKATATPQDIAILSHRIAASYLAEGMDSQAFQLASVVADTGPVPQLDWDAGFSAYRLGRWGDAAAHLEKLAQNGGIQGRLRAQAAFWAARAHMKAGDTGPVIGLLSAAAKEQPSFYGMIAERMLGMDTNTGFSEPVLNEGDFAALMKVPAARRAVALSQVGEGEYVGQELNRAFVTNTAPLDPAMAALARGLGITNIELRASEASTSQGLLLTGLFPVPPYQPEGGYQIDNALVLAFARIESRFQNGSISVAGAHGIMQMMPATARLLAGPQAVAKLDDPAYSLSIGQRYISDLLGHLNGNLLQLGGAYNAGPGAAARWLETKAGKDDPLVFVESIPIAETRSYVRRLMEYQWMYRRRFGEEARSLDQIARGEWPIYQPSRQASAASGKPVTAVAVNAGAL
jgi:soluble lytic murein transglycosylase-like protein